MKEKLKLNDMSLEFGYSRYAVLLMDEGYEVADKVAPFILGAVTQIVVRP